MNCSSIRHRYLLGCSTFPVSCHTLQEIRLWLIAFYCCEVFEDVTALCRNAKPLALVLAPAYGRQFAISLTEQRVKHTNVEFKLVLALRICCTKIESIPE